MKLSPDSKINGDLAGTIAVKFKDSELLNQFLIDNIDNYNLDQYELIALRIYFSSEIIITFYALDKFRQEQNTINTEKLPVKKFKVISRDLNDFIKLIGEANCTLTVGNYPLEDIEVVNK